MNRLKELRLKFMKSQTDIGNYIGISQSGYSSYERGRLRVPPDVVKSLAQYYNVSEEYLLGFDIPIENDKLLRKFNKLSPEIKAKIYSVTKRLIEQAYEREFR